MFLKNEILSINLFQLGEDPNALDTYSLRLVDRQTDETKYTLLKAPSAATERLFRFDLSSDSIAEGQYVCYVSRNSSELTHFNVRYTVTEQKEYYKPGINDSTYGG